MWSLTHKNSEGQTLDASETALIDTALLKWTKVRAIRNAESIATAAVEAATTAEEVVAVAVDWPS